MAEPLSAAASIAGLISLAEVVFRRTYRFLRNVRNAEREIADLSIAVSSLCGVLRGVELVVQELQAIDSVPGLSKKEIHDCATTLNSLREKLSPFEQVDSTTPSVNGRAHLSLYPKWKWPFSRSAMVELVQKIHDHKSQLGITLTAENVMVSVKLFDHTRSIGETVAKTYQLLEAETKIVMNERKERNLHLLSPVRPLDGHKINNSLRHKGTVLWFLESTEFKYWMSTGNGALWVWGIPGAGKTILASAAIQESLQTYASSGDNAVAYFYCDYKSADTQQISNILGSLAQEIARQSEGSYERLEAFLKKHKIDSRNNLSNQYALELMGLVLDMSKDFDSLNVLVDGLDECGDQAEVVTSRLASLNHQASNIRVFLSSRDLPQIREKLENFEKVSIAARNSDLKLYVGAQIEERLQKTSIKRLRLKDLSLKGQIMDKLVEGAQGMFRWVALQLDIICEEPSDKAILTALNSLPRDIFASYERILQNINRKPESSRTLVCRTLKWIVGRGRMDAAALCEAISIEPASTRSDPHELVNIESVLYHCGSFVRKTGNALELAHFTVQEFLTSHDLKENVELSAYWLDGETTKNYMARTCLTYLCFEDFSSSCLSFEDLQSRRKMFPFRYTAVWKWMDRDGKYHNDDECVRLEHKLFSQSYRGNLHSWGQEYLIPLSKGMYSSVGSEEVFGRIGNVYRFISPLHYAAMLGLPELCSGLLNLKHDSSSFSPVGSPIHCALLGTGALLWSILLDSKDYLEALMQDLHKNDPAAREETVHSVLSLGVEAGEQWTSKKFGRKLSTLYLAYTYPGKHGRAMVRNLMESGCHCYPDFLERVSQKKDPEDYDLISTIKPENLDESSKEIFTSLLMKAQGENTKHTAPIVNLALNLPSGDPAMIRKLFLEAASEGCLEVVEQLLNENLVSADLCDENGESALVLATDSQQAEVVECLIRRGASIKSPDSNGNTPLQIAVFNEDLECFKILAQCGMDFKLKNEDSHNILHTLASMPDVDREFWQILELSIQGQDACLNSKDRDGWTALATAAQCQSRDILSLLLGLGADISTLDKNGRTVLHLAASKGNHDAIEFFLNQGTNPGKRDLAGLNTLQHVVSSKCLDSRSIYLLLNEDVTLIHGSTEENSAMGLLVKTLIFEGVTNWEPAFDALKEHLPGFAARLMDVYCSAALLLDDERRGRFHLLVENVSQDFKYNRDSRYAVRCIDKLIDILQPDANIKTNVSRDLIQITCCLVGLVLEADLARIKNGGGRIRSLLCAAAIHGEPFEVRKLLGLGFNVDETGSDGITALAGACEARSGNVELLLDNRANASLKSLNGSLAPVHWAAFRGNLSALKLLAHYKVCWTDTCHVSSGQVRLPQLATACYSTDCLEYILDECDEFSLDDCAGGPTVLSSATMINNIPTIKFLIDQRVDCSKPDDGTLLTPLHIAAGNGTGIAVRLLLEAGANPKAIDKTGRAPWVCAIRAGHSEIASLLRSAEGRKGTLLTVRFRARSLTKMQLTDPLPLQVFPDPQCAESFRGHWLLQSNKEI